MLNTAAEGKRREIIDGNPSASKIPFLAVLDEVGYYMAPGLAVVPAQARSLGVALCFGTQSIPDLMKADENEGKSILDNTAVKMFGRLTSDENSDTARTAISMGGEVHVQVADEVTFQRGIAGLESSLKVGGHSGLQQHSQIAYEDLVRQEDGEFHIIMGTRDSDERGHSSGGARVVRSLAFYTGGIPDIEDWRRNPFCNVNPPSKADQKRFREAEIAARQMKDGLLTALERPSAELLATVRKYEGQSFIGRFLTFRRERMGRGEWPVDPAQRRDMISAWLEETFEADVRRVAIKMEQESIEHWYKSVAQSCNYLGVAGRNGAVVAAIKAMAEPWMESNLAAHGEDRDYTSRVDRSVALSGMEQLVRQATDRHAAE
jgi:hypothetical protein